MPFSGRMAPTCRLSCTSSRKSTLTAYGLIRGSVQRVAPFFDDFELRPDPLNEETIRLAWKHRNSDQYFGASQLSDGTLRFIALATLFLQPEQFRPSVILVDEPELGLHPYAITMLASLIRMASEKTQVIVSTQSPLLLDHFQPEDVLVADRVGAAHNSPVWTRRNSVPGWRNTASVSCGRRTNSEAGLRPDDRWLGCSFTWKGKRRRPLSTRCSLRISINTDMRKSRRGWSAMPVFVKGAAASALGPR